MNPFEFRVKLQPEYNRPIASLYGVNALFDDGSSYVVLGLEEDDVVELFGGIDLHHYIHLDGINRASEEDSIGKVYQIRHFQVGPLEYFDVPVIVKDIDDEEVDIILGGCLYGPGSFVGWDKGTREMYVRVPEMIGRSNKFWDLKEGEVEYTVLERIRNSFAMPI